MFTLAELDLEAEAVEGFTFGQLAGAGAVPFGTLWVGWGEKENRSQGLQSSGQHRGLTVGEALLKGN